MFFLSPSLLVEPWMLYYSQILYLLGIEIVSGKEFEVSGITSIELFRVVVLLVLDEVE
jgi:hypothetical protein